MDQETREQLIILTTTWYHIMPQVGSNLPKNHIKELLLNMVKTKMELVNKQIEYEDLVSIFDYVNNMLSTTFDTEENMDEFVKRVMTKMNSGI